MKICLNITLKYKLIIFISLLVISCNKEDLQEISERPTGKLSDEFKLLLVTKKRISGNFIKDKKPNILAQENEKITVRHLQELGYYYPFVSPRLFQWNFGDINQKAKACQNKLLSLFCKDGKIPTHLCINDFVTRAGVVLSNKYGSYAYIKTGEPKIIEEKIDTLYSAIPKKSWAVNYATDEDMAYNISYSVTTSRTAYWENMYSTSIKVGKEVKIPIGELSVDITLGYSHVEGKSETTSETFSYTPWIYLAPRTKKQVMIIQKDIIRTIKCEIPILISGEVVASFVTWKGFTYTWIIPADLLLKDKGDKLIYEIRVEDIGDVEVYGGKEVPLD